MQDKENIKNKLVSFLEDIGIAIIFETIREPTFLPGLKIKGKSILIDTEKWLYPGDIVHEAGHIAVVPESERESLDENTIGERKDHAAEEMMAIAWSYAVCKHLEIDPAIVFHEDGYKGGGAYIITNFENGNTFGVPMLQYAQMCTDHLNPNRKQGEAVYPVMKKWLRD
jgi:hypothetical protein